MEGVFCAGYTALCGVLIGQKQRGITVINCPLSCMDHRSDEKRANCSSWTLRREEEEAQSQNNGRKSAGGSSNAIEGVNFSPHERLNLDEKYLDEEKQLDLKKIVSYSSDENKEAALAVKDDKKRQSGSGEGGRSSDLENFAGIQGTKRLNVPRMKIGGSSCERGEDDDSGTYSPFPEDKINENLRQQMLRRRGKTVAPAQKEGRLAFEDRRNEQLKDRLQPWDDASSNDNDDEDEDDTDHNNRNSGRRRILRRRRRRRRRHMDGLDPDLLVNADGGISTGNRNDDEDENDNDSQQSVQSTFRNFNPTTDFYCFCLLGQNSENNSEDSGMIRYVNGDGQLGNMFTAGNHEDVTSDDLTLFLTDDPKNPEKRLPVEAGKRETIDGVTVTLPRRGAGDGEDGDDNGGRKRSQRGRKMDGELTKAEKAARRLKGVGLTILSGDSSSSILKL
eukprot:jgi/Bigna1/70355/fgenesh1_pg.11_\